MSDADHRVEAPTLNGRASRWVTHLNFLRSGSLVPLEVEKHSAFRVGAVSSVGLAIVARLRVAVGVRRYRAAQ